MPKRWYERKIKGGRLTVFNGATKWSQHVVKAVADFNGLAFKVGLDWETDEYKADVIVLLSDGKSTVWPRDGKKYNGNFVQSNFDAEKTHGQAQTFLDGRDLVEKVVIFLPEKLKNVPDDVKVVVVVHELIHACGLVEPKDHDPIGGIMAATTQLVDGKLREASTDKSLKGMPPIRLGGWTQCQIALLWRPKGDTIEPAECKP